MADPIEVRGLTKRYRKKLVLDDVGLSVGTGHCLALLGHNGAGKTTLMKLLLGLTAPSAGEVRLLGRDPRGRSGAEARRAVGFLPENVAFEGAMTGAELMNFYADIKGVARAEGLQLLEEVGLAEAARNRVRTFSKGMRQRLGLAQALLGKPRLLFLDEPTNGLDPPLRRHFYEAIAGLTKQGSTALVSSHLLSELEAKADLVAILRAGRLVAFGSLEALRETSQLPVRVRLKVSPETVGAIAEEMGHAFTLERVQGGAMDFLCDSADKMAIVRRIAKLNGEIRDVDILPPHLEEIYAHFASEEARP